MFMFLKVMLEIYKFSFIFNMYVCNYLSFPNVINYLNLILTLTLFKIKVTDFVTKLLMKIKLNHMLCYVSVTKKRNKL